METMPLLHVGPLYLVPSQSQVNPSLESTVTQVPLWRQGFGLHTVLPV